MKQFNFILGEPFKDMQAGHRLEVNDYSITHSLLNNEAMTFSAGLFTDHGYHVLYDGEVEEIVGRDCRVVVKTRKIEEYTVSIEEEEGDEG